MNDRFARLDELFSRALTLDPESRPAYLERECGEDISLRREVEKLLSSSRRAEDFLESSPLSHLQEKLAREEKESERLESAGELAGQTLGNHQLISLIGVGGMGAVYKSRNLTLGRVEAIKILFPHLGPNATSIRRFKREGKAAAALNHPGIAQVYESGEENGLHYIAMEYVEGRTLSSIVRESPLQTSEAVEIAAQILESLKAAHRVGIIHRDIKSANIVVRPDGVVKILDFGLAKIQDLGGSESFLDLSDVSLTAPGTMVGTASYMSPEQVRRDRIDQRTDLFSFGVVLYEMVTGVLPYQGRTVADIIDKICRSDPLPIARVNPEASLKLEGIVRKCLAKDPDLRYHSAADILADLQGNPRSVEPRRRSWWTRILGS